MKIPEHLFTSAKEREKEEETGDGENKNLVDFEERVEISFTKKSDIDNSRSAFSVELKNHKCKYMSQNFYLYKAITIKLIR